MNSMSLLAVISFLFHTLANTLSWESGETLGWAPRVTSNHLETFERQVKESLNSSFHYTTTNQL